MAKGDINEILTANVIGSTIVARPEGWVAIVIEMSHQTIALPLSLQAISVLRRQLTEAESLLLQRAGHA
jgi:hypothetical protein